MASTLFIQVPPRSVADEMPDWREQAFPFCLASAERRLQQHGRQNLQDLIPLARSANQVVLLLASSDVAFFMLEVPPMAPQKLKAALPNLLEEQVLSDPSELLFASVTAGDGRLAVATVQRAWMEELYLAVQVLEPRKLAAYPISLGLSLVEGAVSVLLETAWPQMGGVVLSWKTAALEVSGISLHGTSSADDVRAALQSLELFCKGKSVDLAVDTQLQTTLESELEASSGLKPAQIYNADWTRKIASDFPSSLNLCADLVQENAAGFDWMKWRWSVSLLGLIVVISLFGLNWEWYRLKSEANNLSASLSASYRALFPNEAGLRDPLLQLQQKINQSKKLAGQSTEEDFLVMSGQLAQAWQVAFPQQSGTALESMEYREKSLFVKPKNAAEVQIDPLRSALREYGLRVEAKDGLYRVSRDEGSAK